MSYFDKQEESNCELIFGGSFDPVHYGHLRIIEKLRQINQPWAVRLLPCSIPALKGETSASFAQRVEMLGLLVGNFADVFIDQRENRRSGKSFTIDTLKSLAEENSEIARILVLGSDTLAGLENWYQCQELVNFCHLLVVQRTGTSLDGGINQMQRLGFERTDSLLELEKKPAGLFSFLEMKAVDISSTQVRKNLDLGKTVYEQSIKPLIPEAIQHYIEQNSIFKLEKQPQ